MITLKEAKSKTQYEIVDVNLCEPCVGDSMSCGVVGMMEKGIVPGHLIEVRKRQGGLVWISIEGQGDFILRDDKIDQIFIGNIYTK